MPATQRSNIQRVIDDDPEHQPIAKDAVATNIRRTVTGPNASKSSVR